MSSFDLLHPGLQHHVVNSLGWRELRPFQEEVIPVVLNGDHVVVIAPTAGGKTEAAILPVLSRMLTEDWRGLSTLYLCPIRALLNNLHIRLSRYATLVGRTCSVWHGDTSQSERTQIGREPPDILLTTPESLEVMLVSRKTDAQGVLGQVRVVVVDELHAFAGDDRGWHMLSVLQRVSKLAGREIQRIGLSATVGNPETLLQWLKSGAKGHGQVIVPAEVARKKPDVQLDYVGSIENAAIVISRMHRGEKRLVFVDSRSRAEELGSHLRQLEVKAFVTHSSLSKDQRARAESAFASENDCAIVATSALELGIDVGDLDRVVQIDAPTRVASVLQRMGRTGRRSDLVSNCLFLATNRQALLRAAGLIEMWRSGFVEPIAPPPRPYHVFAQQIMALALQLGGVERQAWREWIGLVPAFAELSETDAKDILDHMIALDILWQENGILWFGRRGETEFGYRNFMDLLSVFTSEPLFTVKCGQSDLGFVHELSFAAGKQAEKTLLLGGRSWMVTHVDWNRRVAYVEPVERRGRSRWLGSGQSMSFELCQSIRRILVSDDEPSLWSQRARAEMKEAREEYSWVQEADTAIVSSQTGLAWWTFAGDRANAAISQRLRELTVSVVESESLSITIACGVSQETLSEAITEIRQAGADMLKVDVEPEMLEGLKFTSCLPETVARGILQARMADPVAITSVLREPYRNVTLVE
ncbi:MAG: DEAD/DEAH box helicase [Phycisphaerae bacterium]|nr:DEAD/DEAH box helicase [Phycisphaerae bacterium]